MEKAIRKLFGETVDDSAYYGDQVCYGDQGYGDEPDLFEDLLEFDEAHGDIYMCLDEPLPAMLDEDEAVSCAGELLSFVYGTASERWSKGKGKMQWQGPTVLWERLWCVRHICGIQEGSSRCPDQPWPVPQLPATGPLAQRRPQKRRVPTPQSPRPGGGQQTSGNRSGGLFTNLFFMGAPSPQTDDAGQVVFHSSVPGSADGFTGFSMDQDVVSGPGPCECGSEIPVTKS